MSEFPNTDTIQFPRLTQGKAFTDHTALDVDSSIKLEIVVLKRQYWCLEGRVKGIPIIYQIPGFNVVTAWKCTSCGKTFIASDPDNLFHECMEPR